MKGVHHWEVKLEQAILEVFSMEFLKSLQQRAPVDHPLGRKASHGLIIGMVRALSTLKPCTPQELGEYMVLNVMLVVWLAYYLFVMLVEFHFFLRGERIAMSCTDISLYMVH